MFFLSEFILLYINIFIFIFLLFLLLVPFYYVDFIKVISLSFSFILFIMSLFMFFNYNYSFNNFTMYFYFSWLNKYNLYYSLGVDGISLFFIVLTTLLIPICFLISWNSINYRIKDFVLLLFLIEFLLINVFSVLDLFFFYIFFESILIPIFLVIGIWGSRQRKIHAAYQLFFYTLFGSILMLLGIISLYSFFGFLDISLIFNSLIDFDRQLVLWFLFFMSFASKIPIFPLHIWLPEAHVEAPTAGSVILAGILLKLGTYGMIRFMFLMFPYASSYFSPFIFTMCILGIIYSSLTTIRQIDLKKIIAYSSVSHMNFCILGLFCNNIQGFEGSLYLMLGHGVVSSGLFLCIGILYDRYHTRNILYYGGLVQVMPIFSVFFLFFILGNIAFPGTVNFIGEFLIMLGLFQYNFVISFLSCLGIIFCGVYSIWLYNRVIFGKLKISYFLNFIDLNNREFSVLFPLIFLMFFMGIYPTFFFKFLYLSLFNLIVF